MTIHLNTFTTEQQARIAPAMEALGAPSARPVITSANRQHARAVLSALGFTYHTVNAATLAELQAAYHSLATDGLGLIALLWDADQSITPLDAWENLCEVKTRLADTAAFIIPSNEAVTAELERLRNASPAPQLPLPSGGSNAAPRANNGKTTQQTSGNSAKTATELMAELMAVLGSNAPVKAAELDEGKVIALIQQHAPRALPTAVEIKTAGEAAPRTVQTGLHHHALPTLIKMLAGLAPERRNLFLVGQAGSGKTTLAKQAAQALGVQFYFNGAIDSEYKLTGFIDAQGRIVSTAFKKAYSEGGLYLFDEVDSSSASALLAFNAALANGHMDFPDGAADRHPNFYCLAAGNTYGKGADRVYCGRQQLDAATLDRFAFLPIDYDETLERALTANSSWCDYVQKLRASAEVLKIRHVISPRASIMGAELIAAGLDRQQVENMVIWKGLDAETVSKIKAA